MEFILVVGSQRSGTTLMAQVIGAHPLAIMIDENDGLYDWTDSLFNNTPIPRTKTFGSTLNLPEMRQNFQKLKMVLRKPSFQSCCRLAIRKYQNPYIRFLENKSLRDSVEFAVLKVPNLTYSFAEIPHVFPRAKIIYMSRDIRDIVSSMMALKRIPILENQLQRILASQDLVKMFPAELSLLQLDDDTVKLHIKMALIAKIKMSLANLFRDNGLNVVNVRYEDLVTHAESVVPYVLDKLGIPFAAECLRHNDVFQGIAPGGTKRQRPLDNKSKKKWKYHLTPQQESEIWGAVGDFMESFGYIR